VDTVISAKCVGNGSDGNSEELSIERAENPGWNRDVENRIRGKGYNVAGNGMRQVIQIVGEITSGHIFKRVAYFFY